MYAYIILLKFQAKLWYLAITCDQAGGRGAVNTFSVTGKMREKTFTPPEDDGQLLVTAGVSITGSPVGGDEAKLHVGQSTLGLEDCSIHHILQVKLVVRERSKRDPDPAQDTK